MIEVPAALTLLGTISGKVFDFVQKRKSRKLMKAIVSEMASVSYEIKELSGFLREEFLWVRNKLDSISEWFADEVRRDALSTFTYICDAINIEEEKLRSELLLEAYKTSTRLTNLNPNSQVLSDNQPEKEVEYMISWGYWGRFIFFLMNNQASYAEKQVYLCTSKYPVIAINLFPGAFFGEHFTILEKVTEEIQKRTKSPGTHYDSIDVLDCADLPSNIQLPLLEIQFNEEIERLSNFVKEKLGEKMNG